MRNIKIIIWLLFTSGALLAQGSGEFSGILKSLETDLGIGSATVVVDETQFSAKTQDDGSFIIKGIPAGIYNISVSAAGYGRTILLKIKISAGQTTFQQIYVRRSPDEGEQFYIGGIEVQAQNELLPEKAATVTSITSGEIEHIQASSLGDALELLPGQKMTNPGLEDVKQIAVRHISTTDEADRNATLGTQILMDGVPLSNNANLQLDTDLNDGSTYRVTVNAGLDLRQIAADNIRSIEVVRGIPPVRFGDLTSGAVIVDTRAGYTPYRAKYKYNPRNNELNLSGGYRWVEDEFGFNVNYARSLRDIRVDGDAYSRISAQLNLLNAFDDDKLQWSNRLYYLQTLDEQQLRSGDLTRTERYNRGFESRLTSDLEYKWSEQKKGSLLLSADLNSQNSYIKRLITRDIGAIGIRMEPGVEEGYFVSVYTSGLRVKGQAWNLFGQGEFENIIMTGSYLHNLLIGMSGRYEFNNGPGRQFDPHYPPRSDANEGDRPRSYSDIPGMNQIALYAEDKVTGHFIRDFLLQAGVRYDIFGAEGISFQKDEHLIHATHGTYLNPRFNLVYYLTDATQIRAGWGRTAKTPPLSMVYPNPIFFDVVDSMYFDPNNSENRLAIINTYVIPVSNTDLKATTSNKFEASIDQRIAGVGISLTGFSERTSNGFELGGFVPVSLTQYSRPAWPQPEPALARDTLLLNYNIAINSVETRTRGLELAITTRKLPLLNSTLRIDAAWHQTESWWQDNHFEYGGRRTVAGFDDQIIPYWNRVGSKAEQLLIHYRLDAIIKELRLWVTVNVQQLAMEKDQYTGLADSLAVGFITRDGDNHVIPEEQRTDPKYASIRRVYDDYYSKSESMPNIWLINLRVSKELWPGSEFSFFVNNLLNSRPFYLRQRVPTGSLSYVRRNPEMFYGVECSMVVDELFNYLKRF